MDERTVVKVYLSPEQAEKLKAMLKRNGFEHPDSAMQYAVQHFADYAIEHPANRYIPKPEQ